MTPERRAELRRRAEDALTMSAMGHTHGAVVLPDELLWLLNIAERHAPAQPDDRESTQGMSESVLLAGVRWPSNEMRAAIVPIVAALCEERDDLYEQLERAQPDDRLARE